MASDGARPDEAAMTDLPANIRLTLSRLATVPDPMLPKVYGEECEERPKVVRYLIWCDLWEIAKWLMDEQVTRHERRD